MGKKQAGTSTSWITKLGTAPSKFVGKPDDLVILFMGPTGAGKSTFIREYTGNEAVTAGHGLSSTTPEVCGWVADVPDEFKGLLVNRRLILVDTPGFDDTFVDDSEILRKVSAWLAQCYNDSMAVAGIVYMNDISQKRMFGSTRMSLNMFMKLCGEESLQRVVLATSQWDSLSTEEQGEQRQAQLQETFWKAARDGGASIKAIRHKPNDQSAIINHIQERFFNIKSLESIALGIQREIVDLKRSLPATTAGRELKSTLDELLRLHKAKQLSGEEKDLERKILRLKEQIKMMRLPITDRIRDFLYSVEKRLSTGESRNTPSKRLPFEGRPRDIVIVIMGSKGSGKTHFIQQFTSEAVATGGIFAGTRDISAYDVTSPGTCKAFKLLKPRRLILVDTPGVDPTSRLSEAETLDAVKKWLSEHYRGTVPLAGIVSLHDIRVRRQYPMDVRRYEEFCSKDGFQNLVVATSRWEYLLDLTSSSSEKEWKAKEVEAVEKENLLRTESFKPVLDSGARMHVIGETQGGNSTGPGSGLQGDEWTDSVERDQEAILRYLAERFIKAEANGLSSLAERN